MKVLFQPPAPCALAQLAIAIWRVKYPDELYCAGAVLRHLPQAVELVEQVEAALLENAKHRGRGETFQD